MRYLCEFCEKILKDPLMDNSEDKPRYFCNKSCKKKKEEDEWKEMIERIKAASEYRKTLYDALKQEGVTKCKG